MKMLTCVGKDSLILSCMAVWFLSTGALGALGFSLCDMSSSNVHWTQICKLYSLKFLSGLMVEGSLLLQALPKDGLQSTRNLRIQSLH